MAAMVRQKFLRNKRRNPRHDRIAGPSSQNFRKNGCTSPGYDASGEAGAGAAGGLGYAFMEFMTAEVKRGADVVLMFYTLMMH